MIAALGMYDRAETQDKAAQHSEITAHLTQRVMAWHQSMPADRGPELGTESSKPDGKTSE